jgi:hypothetical protein
MDDFTKRVGKEKRGEIRKSHVVKTRKNISEWRRSEMKKS